nr:hypothetical protein BaRGS_030839 [Batillaria attramentaria]
MRDLPEDKPNTTEGLGQKLEFKDLHLELGDIVLFIIRFPKKGFYKFYIFATPATEPGSSYPCVFTYLIEVYVPHAKRVAVKAGDEWTHMDKSPEEHVWKAKVYLEHYRGKGVPVRINADKPDTSEGLGQKLEFKQINLELSSHPGASFTVDDNEAEIKIKTPNPIKTTFKLLYVYVPSAKRVAVKAGDEWTHLDKCEDDIWQGKVYLEHYRGKNVPVRINAGWDEESSTYESLLEYTI